MINLDKFFKILVTSKSQLKDFIYNNIYDGTYVVDGYQMKLIKTEISKHAKHLSHNGLADSEYEEIADKIILAHPANFTKNGSYLFNFYFGSYKKMSSDDIKHIIALIIDRYSYSEEVHAILMEVRILLALSNKSSKDIANHTHTKLNVVEDIRRGNFKPNVRDLTINNCSAIKKYLNYNQLYKKAKKQLYSPYYEHKYNQACQKGDFNQMEDLFSYGYIFQGLNDKKTLDKLYDMEKKHVIRNGQLTKIKG